MRKNVEDEELQKIVRILTKSVSFKLNNLWPKKFGYDLGTKAVEFVEGGKCIKGLSHSLNRSEMSFLV